MKVIQKIKEKLPNPKLLAGLIFAIIILAYGLYRTYDLIAGPLLIVDSPTDGEIITDPLISIRGKTKRIAKIFINDKQIFIQNEGNFNESLLLGYGYNIIEVKVQDLFKREIIKTIRVVLN